MIKLDLITGFLGSGKTTFIKRYAEYLLAEGEKICIIENDFGAINVDMVLLKELESEKCSLEMVVGGDGKEAHKRRLKTKLISMGMLGYDRVIIEPSGIYDVDEFFDLVYEEPLDRWYEIGNCVAIINPKMDQELSRESRYILMSEIAVAGVTIMSRADEATKQDKEKIVKEINSAMAEFGCKEVIDDKKIIKKAIYDLDKQDLCRIRNAGYHRTSHMKIPVDQETQYQTVFYFNYAKDKKELSELISTIFQDSECGNVHRIKGMVQDTDGTTYEINSTRDEIKTKMVITEKPVLIVIGENLNKNKLARYLGEPTL